MNVYVLDILWVELTCSSLTKSYLYMPVVVFDAHQVEGFAQLLDVHGIRQILQTRL